MNYSKSEYIANYYNNGFERRHGCDWDFLYDLFCDFYNERDRKLFHEEFYPDFALDEVRNFMAENNLFGKPVEDIIILWKLNNE